MKSKLLFPIIFILALVPLLTFADPIIRDPLVLEPGQIQPIDCPTELLGTLDAVECAPVPVPVYDPGYYVDCLNGDNRNAGTDPTQAWQTVGKVNATDLKPGDAVYFLRGCVFNEQLQLSESGTADSPIRFSAYGDGELPRFRKGNGPSIQISGDYNIIESVVAFHNRSDYPDTDTRGDCTIPQGWRMGIAVTGSHNTLQNLVAEQNAVGVFFNDSASHNKLLHSRLVNNEYDPNPSIGPSGVLLHGTGNEVGYSYFEGNQGECSPPGTAFEVYKAYDSYVHHNIVMNDRKFMEMGISDNTLIAHNVMYNDFKLGGNGAQFIVTRGDNITFGPVTRTRVFNNTVYFANPNDSDGSSIISCGGCAPDILEVRNNIFVTAKRAAWIKGSIAESHNLWWNPATQSAPTLQGFKMSGTSVSFDPALIDPANGDFHLSESSQVFDIGTDIGASVDIDGDAIPMGNAPDLGADEAR